MNSELRLFLLFTIFLYRFIIAGKVKPSEIDANILRCTIKISDLYIIFPPMIVDRLYHKDLEISLQNFKYLLNYGQEMQQKVYKEIDFNPRNFPDQRGLGTDNGMV